MGLWGWSWRLYTGVTTGGPLGLELAVIHWSDDWRLELTVIHRGEDWRDSVARAGGYVTTGGTLGLELVGIHRGDDCRDSGGRAGGYTEGDD